MKPPNRDWSPSQKLAFQKANGGACGEAGLQPKRLERFDMGCLNGCVAIPGADYVVGVISTDLAVELGNHCAGAGHALPPAGAGSVIELEAIRHYQPDPFLLERRLLRRPSPKHVRKLPKILVALLLLKPIPCRLLMRHGWLDGVLRSLEKINGRHDHFLARGEMMPATTSISL